MWNQGKNCMGRRAFRKSNKSMQPGLKLHGTHYVEVLLLDPWQCTFLLAIFPNPHQDACAQLCPIILKIYAKFSKSPSGRVCTVMSHNLKNIYIYPRMLNTMWTLIQTCTLIPTPFTRTCASRMAHRLRQTSLIFRQVEILLAHRRCSDYGSFPHSLLSTSKYFNGKQKNLQPGPSWSFGTIRNLPFWKSQRTPEPWWSPAPVGI